MDKDYARDIDDKVPKPEDPTKVNRFVIIKNSSHPFKYYVSRIQSCRYDYVISNHKRKFPNSKVIMDIYSPNAINLWTRIKEKLESKIEIQGNFFNLKGMYSEKTMVKEFTKIHNERLEKDEY